MAFKDFEIKRNFCDCHPETCSCTTHKMTYKGKRVAWGGKEMLEELKEAIRAEIKLGQKNARSNENKRVMRELGNIDWPRDRHNY